MRTPFLVVLKLCCHSLNFRDISKDKDKCDVGEDEEGKEHNTPRGRKTANSQGRRKGRITTRSMAIEAASVAADEAPPTATDSSLSDPPQLSKTDPAQKAVKELVKPQIPLASLDANKGILLPSKIPLLLLPAPCGYMMWPTSYLGVALHLVVNLFSSTFTNTVKIVRFKATSSLVVF